MESAYTYAFPGTWAFFTLPMFVGIALLYSFYINNQSVRRKVRNTVATLGILLSLGIYRLLVQTYHGHAPFGEHLVDGVILVCMIIGDWLGYFIYKVTHFSNHRFWLAVLEHLSCAKQKHPRSVVYRTLCNIANSQVVKLDPNKKLEKLRDLLKQVDELSWQ